MKQIRNCAAGIDVEVKNIFTAIEGKEVRSFDNFMESFQQTTSYLLENRVETVALGATDIYWIILYEMLESVGLDVWLVNGKHLAQKEENRLKEYGRNPRILTGLLYLLKSLMKIPGLLTSFVNMALTVGILNVSIITHRIIRNDEDLF